MKTSILRMSTSMRRRFEIFGDFLEVCFRPSSIQVVVLEKTCLKLLDSQECCELASDPVRTLYDDKKDNTL